MSRLLRLNIIHSYCYHQTRHNEALSDMDEYGVFWRDKFFGFQAYEGIRVLLRFLFSIKDNVAQGCHADPRAAKAKMAATFVWAVVPRTTKENHEQAREPFLPVLNHLQPTARSPATTPTAFSSSSATHIQDCDVDKDTRAQWIIDARSSRIKGKQWVTRIWI